MINLTLGFYSIGLLASGPLPATSFLDVQEGKVVYNENVAPKIQLFLAPLPPGTGPEPVINQMMKTFRYTDEQVSRPGDDTRLERREESAIVWESFPFAHNHLWGQLLTSQVTCRFGL